MNTPEKFWAKVDRSEPGGCWLWTGTSKNAFGYGRIQYQGRPLTTAHRVAWKLTHGPIADDNYVLHKCDNPPCVNPDHLFLGTTAENTQDAVRKGRYQGNGSKTGPNARGRRLRAADIVVIRTRYATQLVTLAALAEEYGVTLFHVSDICKGYQWKKAGGPIVPAGTFKPRRFALMTPLNPNRAVAA